MPVTWWTSPWLVWATTLPALAPPAEAAVGRAAGRADLEHVRVGEVRLQPGEGLLASALLLELARVEDVVLRALVRLRGEVARVDDPDVLRALAPRRRSSPRRPPPGRCRARRSVELDRVALVEREVTREQLGAGPCRTACAASAAAAAPVALAKPSRARASAARSLESPAAGRLARRRRRSRRRSAGGRRRTDRGGAAGGAVLAPAGAWSPAAPARRRRRSTRRPGSSTSAAGPRS